MKSGLTYFKILANMAYNKMISYYVIYVLVGIVITPYIAIMAAYDDGWFREFKYDTFKRRMKER